MYSANKYNYDLICNLLSPKENKKNNCNNLVITGDDVLYDKNGESYFVNGDGNGNRYGCIGDGRYLTNSSNYSTSSSPSMFNDYFSNGFNRECNRSSSINLQSQYEFTFIDDRDHCSDNSSRSASASSFSSNDCENEENTNFDSLIDHHYNNNDHNNNNRIHAGETKLINNQYNNNKKYTFKQKQIAKSRKCPASVLECVFCKNNETSESWYKSHVLKDPFGKVVCPILRQYNCPNCNNGGGDDAHTLRYCPLKDR